MFNKSTESAVAAMSLLAEAYDGETRLTATEIAERRNLRKPFVAKLLTVLSQAELVSGSPGPHGGYSLARPPEEITLLHISDCFERGGPVMACPFGPDFCGSGPNICPLHDDILSLHEHIDRFLERTSLAVFAKGNGRLPEDA